MSPQTTRIISSRIKIKSIYEPGKDERVASVWRGVVVVENWAFTVNTL